MEIFGVRCIKGGDVIFSVENNAEHISEQEIPKLFDAFYRRENLEIERLEEVV